MIFSNPEFFAFIAIFLVFYYAARDRLSAQNALILVGSYIFYGWWDPRFLLLIGISTGADYIAGFGARGEQIRAVHLGKVSGFIVGLVVLLVALSGSSSDFLIAGGAGFLALLFAAVQLAIRLPEEPRRKFFLWFSVIVNLGILGFFKYFNFFTANFEQLLNSVGFEADFFTVNVLLPVGISFYTFQTMSYSIDIYRGKMEPTSNFIRFAAYVSFFPQLVAGPIERASNLLPMFDRKRNVSWDDLSSGLMLFLWGFYKKTVVADNLAPIADRVFANPSADPAEIMAGVLAFTFQIYGDFSGYTDMARGVARMLGFDLMLNFNMPYFSRTPSEFWERWHISLSSWLRDYLYIPLGGNRSGAIMTYRNLMLTMLIGGLWHGAAWTFVLWGFLHGLILIIARLARLEAVLANHSVGTVQGFAIHSLAATVMFVLVVIAWVPFRATGMTETVYIVQNFFANVPTGLGDVVFFAGPLIVLELITRLRGEMTPWSNMNNWLRFTLVLFLLYSALLLRASESPAFIYFDF